MSLSPFAIRRLQFRMLAEISSKMNIPCYQSSLDECPRALEIQLHALDHRTLPEPLAESCHGCRSNAFVGPAGDYSIRRVCLERAPISLWYVRNRLYPLRDPNSRYCSAITVIPVLLCCHSSSMVCRAILKHASILFICIRTILFQERRIRRSTSLRVQAKLPSSSHRSTQR